MRHQAVIVEPLSGVSGQSFQAGKRRENHGVVSSYSAASFLAGTRIPLSPRELLCSRSNDRIVLNARVASVRAKMGTREGVQEQKSKFYWYDFTVRSRRYQGSTQERFPKTSTTTAFSI